MEHPKAVGDRSTLAVMLALQAAGHAFSVPFGENTRYDLLTEIGTAIARVQCKTGRLRAGSIRFRTSSSYAHHAAPGQTSRDYVGDVDFFAVYCPETTGVYLVPIEDTAAIHRAALRVEPPRNGQRRRIRLASDYIVATVDVSVAERPGPLELATRALVGSAGAR